VVSEKSAVSAAVPSLEGLRMAQTGFRGAAGVGSGGKERTGFHRGRNASAKLEIPVHNSFEMIARAGRPYSSGHDPQGGMKCTA